VKTTVVIFTVNLVAIIAFIAVREWDLAIYESVVLVVFSAIVFYTMHETRKRGK